MADDKGKQMVSAHGRFPQANKEGKGLRRGRRRKMVAAAARGRDPRQNAHYYMA